MATITITPASDHNVEFQPEGDDYASLLFFTAVIDDDSLPVTVTMTLESSPGKLPRCISVTCKARGESGSVKTTDLRLPLERLVRRAARVATFRQMPEDHPLKGMPPINEWTEDDARRFQRRYASSAAKQRSGTPPEPAPPELQRQRNRSAVTDERLERVAMVYRTALEDGESPVLAVMRAEIVSRSYAGQLVLLARKAGFLGPAPVGKAGELPETLSEDKADSSSHDDEDDDRQGPTR